MKYLTKVTFKIYIKHLLEYKLMLFVIFSSVVISSLLNMVTPLLYKKFFDILTASQLGVSTSDLLRVVIWIFVINIISVFTWRTAVFASIYMYSHVMTNLSNYCFSYLHKHSTTFFNNHFVGSLVKRVNRFTRSFEGILDAVTWELIPLLVSVVVATIVLFSRSTILGTAVLVWSATLVFINYLFSIYKLKYDVQRSLMDSKVTGVLADTITNHSNVSLLVGYERERKLFAKVTEELRRLRAFTWLLGDVSHGIQAILMVVLEFGIFYVAIDLYKKGILTVGDFVLIQAYLLTLFNKIWNLGKVIRDFYERLADADEMAEILDMPHDIVDVRRAKPLNVKKGKVEFCSVDFSYHKTRKVLNNFNLKILPGERVALVGRSGAGKSTVVKLLLRVYNIGRGRIEIDGQRTSHVTLDSLHESVGYVPQDSMLFHRTLMENIRYGRPKATDKEVIKASKLAHCHEFISEFPYGYDTYVGERGVKLSGGERQRVTIARAILRGSPVLVLDEATSSLDSESEGLIQDALNILMKGKTVMVIAHRLSTIMKMDRIVVMEEGNIVEQGTHKDLINKKNGIYRKLWEMQAGGFL